MTIYEIAERTFDPETNRLLMVKKDENKSVV